MTTKKNDYDIRMGEHLKNKDYQKNEDNLKTEDNLKIMTT